MLGVTEFYNYNDVFKDKTSECYTGRWCREHQCASHCIRFCAEKMIYIFKPFLKVGGARKHSGVLTEFVGDFEDITWSNPFSGQVDPGWKLGGIAFCVFFVQNLIYHAFLLDSTLYLFVWTCWQRNSFVFPSNGSSTVIVTSLLNTVSSLFLQIGSSFQISSLLLKIGSRKVGSLLLQIVQIVIISKKAPARADPLPKLTCWYLSDVEQGPRQDHQSPVERHQVPFALNVFIKFPLP